MYYSEIKKVDVANCIGIGVSLFVSGCRNHCIGCFNPQTWDFNYGKVFTHSTIKEILDYCDHSYIGTLTILGGEPMEVENREEVLNLCEHLEINLEILKSYSYTQVIYLKI